MARTWVPAFTSGYRAADKKRQTIPWVEYSNSSTGAKRTYLASDAKADAVKAMPAFDMQCVDCHNRAAHSFELADKGVDRAIQAGEIASGSAVRQEDRAGAAEG